MSWIDKSDLPRRITRHRVQAFETKKSASINITSHALEVLEAERYHDRLGRLRSIPGRQAHTRHPHPTQRQPTYLVLGDIRPPVPCT